MPNSPNSANHSLLRRFLEDETEPLLKTLRFYLLRSGLASDQALALAADELLNEVTVEALEHADRFRPSGQPRAWLLGIAANLIKRKQYERSRLMQREPLVRDLNSRDEESLSDDELFDRLMTWGLSRQEQSQDVTGEYVDQSARLEQLEAARQRLLEIMKEAKTTDDLLRVESQLTQRETEIEALKGRVNYLSQTARLSSIQVELKPSVLNQPVVESGWNPAETGRLAAGRFIDSLQCFADFLITFAIVTLPWLVVIGLIGYGFVRWGWKIIARR